MTEAIRAFVAVEIPETLRQAIRGIQRLLKSSGLRMNWVHPENIHLTLKFLGDILPAEIEPILSAMGRCGTLFPAFSLEIRGAGVFPDLRRPRVFWIGSGNGTAELQQLQICLDQGIQGATRNRIRMESRPFRAHLTLARIKIPPETARIVAAIRQIESISFDPIGVGEIHLIQSRLEPTGAVYNRLGTSQIGTADLVPADSP